MLLNGCCEQTKEEVVNGALSQDILRKYLHYNPLTGVFTWIWHHSISNQHLIGTEAGSVSLSTKYIVIGLHSTSYTAHRLAWLYTYGVWPSNQIDHINGVRHDNRLVNLREVSCRVNQQNLAYHREGKLVGATWNKRQEKWVAQIKLHGKQRHLGLFTSEQEAHEAYLYALAHPDTVKVATRIDNRLTIGIPSGITYHKRSKKWNITVAHKGKRYSGGVYLTLEDAIANLEKVRTAIRSKVE